MLLEVRAAEKVSSKVDKNTDDICSFFDPNVKCLESTIKLGGETGKAEPGKIHYFYISNLSRQYKYLLLFQSSCCITSLLWKICISHLLTERSLKRIFDLQKKVKSKKKHSAFVLLWAVTEAVHPWQREGPPQAPAWRTTLASRHQAAMVRNCVCEHLSFIYIYLCIC